MSIHEHALGAVQDIQGARAHEPLGPSGHDACYRQQAYRQLMFPPTDPVSTAAADLGTLVHDGVTHRILTDPDYDPQRLDADVRIDIPGLPRGGTVDVVDWENRIVWDIKTTSRRSFDWIMDRHGGITPEHGLQADIYALGLEAVSPGPWHIGIYLIDAETRSTPDGGTLRWNESTRPADPDAAREAVGRMAQRHTAIEAARELAAPAITAQDWDAVREQVWTFPREGSGDMSRMPCGWCHFASDCWPTPTRPATTPQAESVKDDPAGIGLWAQRYVEARDEESKAKRIKEEAAAFLRGNEGRYAGPDGGTYAITASGGEPKPDAPDYDAMAAIIDDLGLPTPMKPGGTTQRKMTVNRTRGKK